MLLVLVVVLQCFVNYLVTGARLKKLARAQHDTSSSSSSTDVVLALPSVAAPSRDYVGAASSVVGAATPTITATEKTDNRGKEKVTASTTNTAKEVIDLGSDTEEEEEEEGRSRWNPTTKEDRDMKSFYLSRVPSTKAGKLFQEYERRYWKARRSGLAGLGKRRRFFDTKNEPDLTKEECDEFRKLAKRFTTRVSEKSPGKLRDRLEHQIKHQGHADEAVEAQLRATQRRAQRYHLIRRLKRVLAGLAAPGKDDDGKKRKFEVKWLKNHDKMLQGIVAEEPLHAEDPLIQLYRQYLAIKQVPSCISLPS